MSFVIAVLISAEVDTQPSLVMADDDITPAADSTAPAAQTVSM